MKWADYCISKVRYNPKHTHIESVIANTDLGEKFGQTLEMSRQLVIDKITLGQSFVTMTLSTNEWKKGQPVKIIKVKSKDYIKTIANQTEDDNLGELPEY